MAQQIVPLTNHVIPGPDLHCALPLVLTDFRKKFLPNVGEDQRKVVPYMRGALALCHMVNLALVIALR